MPVKKVYRKERFAGCMLGAAMGDAMGAAVKSLSRNKIKEAYGKKGLTKPKPDKGQRTVRISDETQLMLFTAHGILWADEFGAKHEQADYTAHVFYALQQWLFTQTGGTSTADLQWILDDEQTGYECALLDIPELCKKRSPTKQLVQTLAETDDRNYGRIIKPINQNKLFDCVPRVAAAGLYFYSDPERAFRMGCEFAAITHSAPTGYLAAGCFASIIAFLCRKKTIEEAVQETLKILSEYDGCEECGAALEKAMSLLEGSTSPLTDVAELGNGSTAESVLAIGVYCACVHYEYDSAVLLAVNQDGNSDACAAVTGAIKGVYLGRKELPKSWLKKLQLADVVEEYSGRLCYVAPKKFI